MSVADKALVAGWFSFPHGGSTAGDLMAADVACDWLDEAGVAFDLALAEPFEGGVDWRAVDPAQYAKVIFVCGPFRNFPLEREFIAHFQGCKLFGLDLSMPAPLEEWNPFDVLIERDSSRITRPDLAAFSRQRRVPTVGVCLVEPYDEIDRSVHAFVQRLLQTREMGVVLIDTRMDDNITGLCTPPEVESVIARMDAVVTTRLHGLVMALKNGVPPLAIDADLQCRKILRQGQCWGWPAVFRVDQLDDTSLAEALEFCLSESGRAKAAQCRAAALQVEGELREQFIAAVSENDAPAPGHHSEGTRFRITRRPRLALDDYPHAYRLPPAAAKAEAAPHARRSLAVRVLGRILSIVGTFLAALWPTKISQFHGSTDH